MSTADIGVVGLAVMGSNLARNFARHGFTVAVYNRTHAKTTELIEAHGDEGDFVASEELKDFVASLKRPRKAMIMVQAGNATDAVIDQLAALMEPGDMIIDGGNAHFENTRRREAALREKGLHFVGTGVSGGEEGALLGPAIMPGGSEESYESLGPILEAIAAKAPDGTPCCSRLGPDGAGHFVKMVHNGIEYSDMQLIGEAYDLLRRGVGIEPADLAKTFSEWNAGELDSYLIEVTAEVLGHTDAATGKPLVDVIVDQAGQKGTGRWTVQIALDLGVPVTGIAEATFARALSSGTRQREGAVDVLTGPTRRWTFPERTSSKTSARRSTPPRSSRTRRASTRSPPPAPNTTGASTSARARPCGARAASSGRASSTASPRRGARTRSCRPCLPPRSSRRS